MTLFPVEVWKKVEWTVISIKIHYDLILHLEYFILQKEFVSKNISKGKLKTLLTQNTVKLKTLSQEIFILVRKGIQAKLSKQLPGGASEKFSQKASCMSRQFVKSKFATCLHGRQTRSSHKKSCRDHGKTPFAKNVCGQERFLHWAGHCFPPPRTSSSGVRMRTWPS